MSVASERIQLKAVQQFAQSAEGFCTLMESSEATSDAEFVRRCASALAGLYRDALELPDQEDDSCAEIEDMPSVSVEQLHVRVHQHLKQLNSYSACFDPYDPESGTFMLLGDDLADIYRDVRSGLELYHQGTHCAIVDAVFDWKFGFSTHWGRHLVSALTALHRIIAGNLLADDEQPDSAN